MPAQCLTGPLATRHEAPPLISDAQALVTFHCKNSPKFRSGCTLQEDRPGVAGSVLLVVPGGDRSSDTGGRGPFPMTLVGACGQSSAFPGSQLLGQWRSPAANLPGNVTDHL